MMTVVGVFLMLGVCAVVHGHKVHKTQVGCLLAVMLVMLNQLNQFAGLFHTEAGQQTAPQHQNGQQRGND